MASGTPSPPGEGSVKIRAVCDVQEIRKGRTAIIATELPYQVSIERIQAKIRELVENKRLEGIADIRNESSDRVGIRLVIELKSGAVPQVVLNQLFKNTPLQDSFGYNMVSLVDGVPRTLDLAEMVGYYLDHQMEVVERRTRFRLEEAQARAHILEGLIIAVDNIDEVIKIIRGSADTAAARENLIDRFELSEIQAAVLDMPCAGSPPSKWTSSAPSWPSCTTSLPSWRRSWPIPSGAGRSSGTSYPRSRRSTARAGEAGSYPTRATCPSRISSPTTS